MYCTSFHKYFNKSNFHSQATKIITAEIVGTVPYITETYVFFQCRIRKLLSPPDPLPVVRGTDPDP